MKTVATAAKNVDEYIHQFPPEVQVTLEKTRAAIKAAAPGAEELISYQIPTFKYLVGLVGFAAYKEHCGFYTMSHAVMEKFKEELKPYDCSGITIRTPLNKPLPATLIKKIVKERIKENEAARAKKK